MQQEADLVSLPIEAVNLIRKSMLCDIQDELANLNVFILMQQLPPQIHAFIYRTSHTNVIIAVDDSLCPEAQRHAILHEAIHLHIDMVPNKRMFKLDKINSRRERLADGCARNIVGVI